MADPVQITPAGRQVVVCNPDHQPTDQPIDPILVGHRAAARILGISESTLERIREREGVPFMRMGWRVLYSPEALRQWVAGRIWSECHGQPDPT